MYVCMSIHIHIYICRYNLNSERRQSSVMIKLVYILIDSIIIKKVYAKCLSLKLVVITNTVSPHFCNNLNGDIKATIVL